MSVTKTIQTKIIVSAESSHAGETDYLDFEWEQGKYTYVHKVGNIVALEADDLKELGLALINLGKAMEARNAQQTS